MSQPWIGVDFDGTLAVYDKWQGPTTLGAPIAPMVERVKRWVAEGKDVRIVTARAYAPDGDLKRWMEVVEGMKAIRLWCEMHIGVVLPITCSKDFDMIELWDDRCVQVERNTGRMLAGDDASITK